MSNPVSVSTASQSAASMELSRHEGLRSLRILDTPEESEFDQLVLLASQICSTPISLVSLVDHDRQWFKAVLGLSVRETPRNVSFCAHAIQRPELFIVEDASKDDRFRANALVTSGPNIRFYAGLPIQAPNGAAIGTLCVIDTQPRVLTEDQKRALIILAAQVQARMDMRYQRNELRHALAELAHTNAQLHKIANTDSLTGLTNRRAFQPRIEHEFDAARKTRKPLTVVLMDVDDFKRRNDELGHAAGDQALAFIGSVLRQSIRNTDIAVRLGGEEFALLLPDLDGYQGLKIAQRIQNTLRQHPGAPSNLTMSIGIATSNDVTPNWEQLFSHADKAMYQAKSNGKNRIVTYPISLALAAPKLPGMDIGRFELVSRTVQHAF